MNKTEKTKNGTNRILKASLIIGLAAVLMFATFSLGQNWNYKNWIQQGQTIGYEQGFGNGTAIGYVKGEEDTLAQITEMMKTKGVNFNWTKQADGSYRVDVTLASTGELLYTTDETIHLLAQQRRPYENLDATQKAYADSVPKTDSRWSYVNDGWQFLIAESYHAMTVVDLGKNYTQQQLFAGNATQKALYLAASNTTDAVDVAWTELPDEYVTNGLSRALADYYITGTGTATFNHTFTIAGTGTPCATTQAYAVYYAAYGGAGNTDTTSLVAAEQQAVGNIKNLNSGDTLTLTVSWSHT